MSEVADIQRRFRQALELFELAEAMVRQRFVRENPGATEAEVAAHVRAWRLHRPGAEHGDAWGRPGTWPRR